MASNRSQPPMSMEAMLDEERREVLELLERRGASPRQASRSPGRPVVPVRSMLDFDDGPAPAPPPVRSMLDFDGEPGDDPAAGYAQSMVDGASSPDFSARSGRAKSLDPTTAGFQFGNLSRVSGPSLPKRNTQGPRLSGAALSSALGLGSGPAGRHHSVAAPSSRLLDRSKSPTVEGRHRSVVAAGSRLDDGSPYDLKNAYLALSDAKLMLSSGPASDKVRQMRARRIKENPELLTRERSAGDDASNSDADGDDSEDETLRGRQKDRRFVTARFEQGQTASSSAAPSGPDSPESRKSTSMLPEAAEGADLPAPQRYRSLVDDAESGNICAAAKDHRLATPGSAALLRQTMLNAGNGSSSDERMDSEDEAAVSDIHHAQRLPMALSKIREFPDAARTIRFVYRGDYLDMVKDGHPEEHRQRKYLVATDLSEESAHAMEWTIGTVLRDGDTLVAVYCVDEETGIATADGNALVPPDFEATNAAASVSAGGSSGRIAGTQPPSPGVAQSGGSSGRTLTGLDLGINGRASPALSGMSGGGGGGGEVRTRADEERYQAVGRITERVSRLLRKTSLQVRVIIEVLHCKNPRHMITEVIDIIEPTLVILGSRGRSALNSVILGSFSNYLVTKSSVPVMVARKKLRKQGKSKRMSVFKQVNNISSPTARTLANAKVD